ncbi:MAG: autoinducer binding domain-containing protein, partial [Rhodobacterales bacterium]|nr:autoinducer binding domain-containing protein [Rhodobacterales bacterium]
DSIILTNHPKSYTDVYMGQGLYKDAPVIDWLLENDGAVSWEIIAKMFLSGEITDKQKKVFAFNQQQKVTAGYSIGFKSISPRTKGAIAMTAREGLGQDQVDVIWDKHGDEILLINNVVHLKVMSLPYHSPERALTKRQREALHWVGDGKTMQDIAVIMGLTSATIEKHLRLARQTLSVETTAQAVLKASFQNQMFIVEA